jgi:hypothetical protein
VKTRVVSEQFLRAEVHAVVRPQSANDLDVVVISIAGTTKELWPTYAPTFDRMSAFELIDMKRFEK